MYPWIWRHLPAPFPLRLATALVLVAGVVAVLLAVWIGLTITNRGIARARRRALSGLES
jgi:hypothetical protein